MATDIGTANSDKTQWSFTLKDGMKWQDGTPVTCADEAYGVSRAFATETGGGPKYAVVYLDIPRMTTAARSTRARTPQPQTSRPCSIRPWCATATRSPST